MQLHQYSMYQLNLKYDIVLQILLIFNAVPTFFLMFSATKLLLSIGVCHSPNVQFFPVYILRHHVKR